MKFFRKIRRGLNKIFGGASKVSSWVNNKIINPYKKVRHFVNTTPGIRELKDLAVSAIPGGSAIEKVVNRAVDYAPAIDKGIKSASNIVRDLNKGNLRGVVEGTKNIVSNPVSRGIGKMVQKYAAHHINPKVKQLLGNNYDKVRSALYKSHKHIKPIVSRRMKMLMGHHR